MYGRGPIFIGQVLRPGFDYDSGGLLGHVLLPQRKGLVFLLVSLQTNPKTGRTHAHAPKRRRPLYSLPENVTKLFVCH